MAISKKAALSILFTAAESYRKNLIDQSLLFSEIVYAAKKIEWNMIKLPESLQYLPLPKQEK
jgi:hypothetical protein